MNAQTQITATPQMNSVGLLNLEAFELSQRVAKMLASSTLVPEQYRAVLKVKAGKDQSGQWVYRDEENPNGLSNCVIALNMANRMGADPLMIMQNLYLIEGRPSWSSQFIMASINSCGRFSSLRFEMENLGEKEVEYQETSWANGRKQNVTKKIKIQNLTCVAWVIERETGERLESSKISIEMAVKEGWYGKNGSKWQTMPEQMLRYRAASFFGRVYAPELLMGLRSAEEEQDRIIDVTPDQDLIVKTDTSQLKRAILAVKSPAELEALEKQVFDIADEEPRKELMKLINAQAEKFQPKTVVDTSSVEAEKPKTKRQSKTAQDIPAENVQNSTEKEALVEANPAKSAEVKKRYSVALTEATTNDAIKKLQAQFDADNNLIDTHKSYLNEYVNIRLRAIETAAQQQKKQPTVDKIKSGSAKAGIEHMIADAQDIYTLETQVAQTINGHKDKLTAEDHQELLTTYAQRKEVLSQQDIFSNALSLVDSYLQNIEQAQSVDRLAEIMSDPTVNSLPDADTARINEAYDRRYAELSD